MSEPLFIDPEDLMAVVEKHAATVTLSFLCDLMPVLGMRLRVSIVDLDEEPSA